MAKATHDKQEGNEMIIRKAYPAEFSLLGELTVDVYARLPGMPSVVEQPDYYGLLRDVAMRAHNPANSVFTAVSDSGELLGTVNFFADMSQYGSDGAASSISNAAGIRYLAVKLERRGGGIGRSQRFGGESRQSSISPRRQLASRWSARLVPSRVDSDQCSQLRISTQHCLLNPPIDCSLS